MTWKPRPLGGPPSAWIEIAASAWAAFAIAARRVMHGPQPVSVVRVSTTRAPCARSTRASRSATSRLYACSAYPSSVEAPTVSHAFCTVPASTSRAISATCAALPPLWPGSIATVFPASGSASARASARDIRAGRYRRRSRGAMRRSDGRRIRGPRSEEPAVVRDEMLLLVGRERRLDDAHEQVVELARREPLVREFVEVREVAPAELLVALDLEIVVGETAVALELLLVRERLVVADLEVVACRLVDRHRPFRRDAERRPPHERLHRPREVVVQRRQRDVGRRVRVVDRVRDTVLHDRLARVELPAEERIHEPRDRHDLVPELRREEVVPHVVAVVHRLRRVEPHRHRLRADRERADEDVEVLERG